MSHLPRWDPTDDAHRLWKEALERLVSTLRLRREKAFRWLDARKPLDVMIPGVVREPYHVYVRSAVQRTDAKVVRESTPRLLWHWVDGRVRVEGIDLSNTSIEYDVILVAEV